MEPTTKPMGLETCRLQRAGQKSSLRRVGESHVIQLESPPFSGLCASLCAPVRDRRGLLSPQKREETHPHFSPWALSTCAALDCCPNYHFDLDYELHLDLECSSSGEGR